jgi:hypothetical protein
MMKQMKKMEEEVSAGPNISVEPRRFGEKESFFVSSATERLSE